jgi:hypothetical protein
MAQEMPERMENSRVEGYFRKLIETPDPVAQILFLPSSDSFFLPEAGLTLGEKVCSPLMFMVTFSDKIP